MNNDLKKVLRGLLRAIHNCSQISKNIEQAVLEIEGRQVESLSNQNSREVSFQFSLPFSDADPVQVGLYREQDVEDSTNYRWIINLHTKSDVLGEIWLKTSLLSQSNVEMIMWAPQAEVAEGARLVTSELEYELKNFGLILDKFTVLNAARPVSENAPGGAGNVVDVST